MSLLLFAESHHNQLKKQVFEAASFASDLAQKKQEPLVAVVVGEAENIDELATYSVEKVFTLSTLPSHFDTRVYASIVKEIADSQNIQTIVASHNANTKAFLPYLSVQWEADYIPAVNTLAETVGPLSLGRSVYSGKAEATLTSDAQKKIITVSPNSISLVENQVSLTKESVSLNLPESTIQVSVMERETASIPLPEAERVVSGGRGLGGPENWNLILDLAEELEAATACSRPVADMGWRPHYEHVGQTGVMIKPNLYIAIGISGAIQHLGGVNQSKVIVVINKDPEAPFFKAATYGVVGDLFDVVPRLIEEVKKYKSSQ